MEIMAQYFRIYIIILSVMLIALSINEFIFPEKVFRLWNKWVANKYFPIHGIILMIGGFPITQFRSSIPGKIMLIIGIVVMFTGPFILLFPDKVRKFLKLSTKDLDPHDIKHLVYMDGVMHVSAGLLFLLTMLYA